jgi:hypothetical protein
MPSKRNTTSGSVLEATVISTFSRKNFEIASYTVWSRNQNKFGKELLLTNVPYETIYNHKGRTEFLAISEKFNKKIRIECKWQQTSGSVDEKLPYLYLSAIEKMTEDEIIILHGGSGFKPGAIQWLKDAVSTKKYIVDPNYNRKIHVFTIDEFLTWANNTFR